MTPPPGWAVLGVMAWLGAGIGRARAGTTLVTGIRQYNPHCSLLDGWEREQCEEAEEAAGWGGVGWWAWLLLALGNTHQH